MAGGGVRLRGPEDVSNLGGGLVTRPPYQPPNGLPNNSLTSQYGLYNSGTEQNAEDYSDIMSRYRDLYNRAGAAGTAGARSDSIRFQPTNYSPIGAPAQISPTLSNYTPRELSYAPSITPERMNYIPGAAPTNVTVSGRSYTPDAELVGALNKFKQLGETGGYSDQDISALRARGISPIRAVYANAQRNVERNRALRGGMGSNYGAVSAKMARELADTIGEQTNRVNAGIAEQVAAGRLEGNKGYGNLASAIDAARAAADSENMQAKNRIGEFNADAMNRYNEANAGRRFDTERLNTEAINRANEMNALGRADVNRFNVEGANQANELNTRNLMDINRYNTEGINKANEMNWNAINENNRYNTQGANDIAKFNAQFGHQSIDDQMRALEGMRGMYGTTPALSNLYGSQASNFFDQQQRANEQNNPLRYLSLFR